MNCTHPVSIDTLTVIRKFLVFMYYLVLKSVMDKFAMLANLGKTLELHIPFWMSLYHIDCDSLLMQVEVLHM